jgi:Protein of unknown function (DUF2840)
VRTVGAGEPFQTLPFVSLGGDILLKIEGWPKVERMVQAIDAIEARPFLSHLDDDLASCTPFLDVSQSLFGRCEWKDPIHHWAYDPRIDERTDLAQLVSACSHEKE